MQDKNFPNGGFNQAAKLKSAEFSEKTSGQKPFTIRITVFLGIIVLAVLLMMLVIARSVLTQVDGVSETARQVREQSLPELMENQRSFINIESLRRIAEITYVTTDPQVRRSARISAQALAAESVFDSREEFRQKTLEITAKIIEIARLRDAAFGKDKELRTLSEEYYTNLEAVLNHVQRLDVRNKIHHAFFHSNISHTNYLSDLPLTWSELEKNQEKDAELLALVSAVCQEQNAQTYACERSAQVHSRYIETQQFMLFDAIEAREKWTSVDTELREFRDSLSTNSEWATHDSLERIEDASKEAHQMFFFLFLGSAVFVVICVLIVQKHVVRPTRWAAETLQKLQRGDLEVKAPKIQIRELGEIAQLLENFSSHISDIYRHTSQLEEDSAGKRDLEEVMRVVFMASLDGYSIWDENGPVEVSDGLLKMLGFEHKEGLINHWRNYDQASESERQEKYRKAREYGYLREEDSLTRQDGKKLPMEVTYLPITFRGKEMILRYARDLREQKRTEVELRKAKQDAEAGGRAKSDFLARMSHEIRTPMNGVLGLTYLALENNPPPEQREYLEKIQASARILLGVINDILDFSKIEEDKITLADEPFSLKEIVSTVADLFLPQAEEKGLQFRLKMATGIPDVLVGDSLRLSQVLLNLCSNAVKFTSQGQVLVQIDKLNESEDKVELKFSVTDTGVGLNGEDLTKIFQPFSQIHNYATRQTGGTGLGLVISKRMVELMGGQLLVESKINAGSDFNFRLLFPKGSMVEEKDISGSHKENASLLEGVRVLLVEDNLINQEIAEALLCGMGAKVTIAENGQEGLDILKEHDFDIILMDIQMPIMDGLTATELIRKEARPEMRNVPIIAMTAHVMQEDRDKSRQAGMNEHITKPIDVRELKDKMVRCLHDGC